MNLFALPPTTPAVEQPAIERFDTERSMVTKPGQQVGIRLRRASPLHVLLPLQVLLGFCVATGNFLQVVRVGGGLSLFGFLWTVAALMVLLIIVFPESRVHRDAAVPILFGLLTASLMTLGNLRYGTAPQTLAVSISIAGFPLLIALGSGLGHWPTAAAQMSRTLERALFVQACLIAPKILLFGLNSNTISSRPFGLAAAFAIAWRTRRFRSVGALLRDSHTLILLGCVLLSQSRTAFMGASISILLVAFIGTGRVRVLRALAALLLVVGTAAGILAVSGTARSRVFGADETADGVSISLSNRESIWPELVAEILANPLDPRGAGTSSAFVEEISNGAHANPHNDYLRIGFEAGALGLLSVLGAITSLSLIARRRLRSRAFGPPARAALAILATLVASMAFTNILTYLSVTWPAILLASLGATARRRR